MKPIPVPKEIRDAPLPEGYVWCDGTGVQWPAVLFGGAILCVATQKMALILTNDGSGWRLDNVPVENIDQAFALINAKIILGDEGWTTKN